MTAPLVLVIALAVVQDVALRVDPADPLHWSAELELGPQGTRVEHAVDFAGSLSIWVSSESLDPRLAVEVTGRDGLLEDDDAGGGTTAWVLVDVEPGDALSIALLASDAADGVGAVELHVVAAPETDATRSAAASATEELAAIERWKAEGALEEARARAAALVDELVSLPGARTSRRIGQVLWRAGLAAQGLAGLPPAGKAFAEAHTIHERYLPPDHPDLLAAKANLAIARRALGDLAGANALFEALLAARERLLPIDHPDLLATKQGLAITRVGLGDLAGANAMFEAVLAARERLLPADHPDVLSARQNLAGTRYELGDPAGAKALLEAVHAEYERRLPADHPHLLGVKQNLAVTRKMLGDLAGALALEESLHATRERLLPPDHPDLLVAKQNLANSRKSQGDLAGALALLEAVHKARERLLPPDHPDLLAAKQALAPTRRVLGDLAGALALEEAVLAARERLLPPDHPDLLAARQNLAVTLKELGDLAGGLALEESVLEARERLLPADHPNVVLAKQNLAGTRFALGDLAGARVLFEAVHAARERLLPADHPDLLAAKLNLALSRSAQGDLAGALALEEAVLAARERLLPADHPDLLAAKTNLALTRSALGDLAGALALEEAVHAASERLFPVDHPDRLGAKLNLAATRYSLDDLSGALVLGEEVRAAWERLLPADHPDLLLAKSNLALTRSALGDLAGALALLEEVQAAWERLLPADHPHLLVAKGNVAVTRKALGDLAGALESLEAVHAELERLLPADHHQLLAAKQGLAQTRRACGDVAGAHALVREIADSLASVAARAVFAAPREARATSERAVHRLAMARFSADAEGSGLQDASFEVLETLRYAVGSPILARAAGLARGEVDAIRERLLGAETELDRLVSSGSKLPDADDELDRESSSMHREEAHRAWREAIQGAALRRDRAQRELLALVGGDFVARVTADSLAEALGSDAVAIGITKLDRWRWDEKRRDRVNDGSHYLAFVLLPGGEPRELDLGPANELEEKIHAWRNSLGAPLEQSEGAAGSRATIGDGSPRGFGVAPLGEGDEVEAGRALRQALVDPLLAAAGNPNAGTTLHLCLDDALFTVPVDALPLDEPKEGTLELMSEIVPANVARLGDRYRVRYELSMARLIRPGVDLETPPSVLAVGDVDFDAGLGVEVLADADPLHRSAWGNWDRLSATTAEVSELELQAKRHLGVDAQVLRRDQVTQAALADAVRGKRYVHLATHGWFLPKSERKSILDDEPHGGSADGIGLLQCSRALAGGSSKLLGGVSAGGRSGNLLGNRETVTGFAPLALCGLVLSGANAGETEAERLACLLSAQELASFDLVACDLAVLSACETNVGIARAGQGIQSLQSALHMAGARTSITSLWAVRDWPTQSLMERFYDSLWEKKLSKADALWEAKRALRREGEPPHAWAGWVLAGDPE